VNDVAGHLWTVSRDIAAVSEGRHDTYAHASCPRDSDLASYRVRRRGGGGRGWCTRGRVGQRRGEDASAGVVVVVHFGGGFARGEDAGRGRRSARCARQPCSVSVAPRHGFGRPKPMLSAGTVHALSPRRGRRASGRAAGAGFGARPHRGVRSGTPDPVCDLGAVPRSSPSRMPSMCTPSLTSLPECSGRQFPQVETMLRDAEDDLLAFTGLPVSAGPRSRRPLRGRGLALVTAPISATLFPAAWPVLE
jgi:hypothetical protein